MPKTGTSTIQQYLTRSGDPRYLGKAYRSSELEHLFRHVIPFSDLRTASISDLRGYRALLGSECVISDEIMSGVGFMHGIAANSLFQILDNLSVLTDGDYRAIVVLRRPIDFLRSYHAQLVRMGGRIAFDQFCSLVLLRQHRWVFRSLCVAPILETAKKDSRLIVHYYEDIFSSSEAFSRFMRGLHYDEVIDHLVDRVLASYSDEIVDGLARIIPHNPALNIEQIVTAPSHEEYNLIDRSPDASLHQAVWDDDRTRLQSDLKAFFEIQQQVLASASGGGNRERGEIFQRLMSSIIQANSTVATEYPNSGASRHRYFEG